MTFILALIIFIVAIAVSIFVTGMLVKLMCWAFGIAFSWKLAMGVWAIVMLVSSAVKSSSRGK